MSTNKRPVLGFTRPSSNIRIEGLRASPPWSLPLGSDKYSSIITLKSSMQAPKNSTETEHNGHKVSLLLHEREGAKLPSQSAFPKTPNPDGSFYGKHRALKD